MAPRKTTKAPAKKTYTRSRPVKPDNYIHVGGSEDKPDWKEFTLEDMRILFSADASTGIVTWNRLPASLFISTDDQARWNIAYGNKPVLFEQDDNGVQHVKFVYLGTKRNILIHHIVYAVCTGEYSKILAHIDGNNSNNKLSNLFPKDLNASAFPSGVMWDNRKDEYFAQVRIKGQTFIFDGFVYAIDAFKKYIEVQYAMHDNFKLSDSTSNNDAMTLAAFSPDSIKERRKRIDIAVDIYRKTTAYGYYKTRCDNMIRNTVKPNDIVFLISNLTDIDDIRNTLAKQFDIHPWEIN